MASGASLFSSIRLLLVPLFSVPFPSPFYIRLIIGGSSFFGHFGLLHKIPPRFPIFFFIPEYFACLWNLLHTWGWMVYIMAWRDWPGAGDADGHHRSWAMEWIYAYLGFHFLRDVALIINITPFCAREIYTTIFLNFKLRSILLHRRACINHFELDETCKLEPHNSLST
jgi:hypothetical protein